MTIRLKAELKVYTDTNEDGSISYEVIVDGSMLTDGRVQKTRTDWYNYLLKEIENAEA